MLHGPPGTGKTLIARKIGEILGASEVKIISGPEIFGKWVGESEANIRDIFKDAEEDFKKNGKNAKLHLAILDEFDAICAKRRKVEFGSNVANSVVNQLLTKMDGVESAPNIILIGTTNRLELIDEALLRPGRFEVKLEIHLPTLEGRQQIFDIHTKRLQDNKALGQDVDMEELARLTPNYSGAEIKGVVNAALSRAQCRIINPDKPDGTIDPDALFLTQEDFTKSIHEIVPLFGRSADNRSDLQSQEQMGFLSSYAHNHIVEDVVKYATYVYDSPMNLGTILLYSDNHYGTGKSTLLNHVTM